MRIAIIGCGFVADYYMATLSGYPHLEVIGAADRDAQRAARFGKYHTVPTYGSVADLLADGRVELVLNLTNPGSHYEVSKACLEAGKHVYSEKPLAMRLDDARSLVELAERTGRYISSAPCSLLGETAQTILKALRENVVGRVRLVYAEMDEGMVYQMPYRHWVSGAGAPWPYKNEFEVGTTIEHAGYVVSWLPAFFGPAETVTGFSACLAPEKIPGEPLDVLAPDLAVSCIRFASGVVVRLTCSLIASHDHSLRIFGDKGVLRTNETWSYTSPVYVRRSMNLGRRAFQLPWRKYRLVRSAGYPRRRGKLMDYARGVAELADSATAGRPGRLSGRYSLHVNEIVLAVHNAQEHGATYRMTTTWEPTEAAAWTAG
jgi:predicted dehydrogenase